MLKIYIDGLTEEEQSFIKDEDIIDDVELAFDSIRLCGSKEEALILSYIEQAEYKDASHIIDRFGDKLSIDFISTGCKAALLVLNHPELVISLMECGYNARDFIINHCKNGTVIIAESPITIVKLVDKVDIDVDGYKFTDIHELNHYIQDYYSVNATDYVPYDGGVTDV